MIFIHTQNKHPKESIQICCITYTITLERGDTLWVGAWARGVMLTTWQAISVARDLTSQLSPDQLRCKSLYFKHIIILFSYYHYYRCLFCCYAQFYERESIYLFYRRDPRIALEGILITLFHHNYRIDVDDYNELELVCCLSTAWSLAKECMELKINRIRIKQNC